MQVPKAVKRMGTGHSRAATARDISTSADDGWRTITEASKRYNMPHRTIRDMVYAGKLIGEHRMVGKKKVLYLSPESVRLVGNPTLLGVKRRR